MERKCFDSSRQKYAIKNTNTTSSQLDNLQTTKCPKIRVNLQPQPWGCNTAQISALCNFLSQWLQFNSVLMTSNIPRECIPREDSTFQAILGCNDCIAILIRSIFAIARPCNPRILGQHWLTLPADTLILEHIFGYKSETEFNYVLFTSFILL